MDIVIEIDRVDLGSLEPLTDHGLVSIVSDRFSGTKEIAEAIINLTPASLVAVTAIVVQLIKSRRYVRIVTKTIRLEGMSEQGAIEALKMLAHSND